MCDQRFVRVLFERMQPAFASSMEWQIQLTIRATSFRIRQIQCGIPLYLFVVNQNQLLMQESTLRR